MSTIQNTRSRSALVPRLAVLLGAVIAAGTVLVSSASAAVAPSNTALPAVSGTAVVGSTLTASAGTWSGDAPITFGYQWQRCDSPATACADIVAASSSTYVLTALDSAGTVRVAVVGTNTVGSQIAYSAVTSAIANADGAPASTVLPSISGSAIKGMTLTGSVGTWAGSLPITFTSVWRRCDAAGSACQTIAGATGLAYVLAQGDVGQTVRFDVTAANIAGSVVATSSKTAVVTGAPTTVGQPLSKSDCKRGGWRTFTSPSFRNQGQCVRLVASHSSDNGHHGLRPKEDDKKALSKGDSRSDSKGDSKGKSKGHSKGHSKKHGHNGGGGDDD